MLPRESRGQIRIPSLGSCFWKNMIFESVVCIFIMIVCDFRNLWIIWDRNRWSGKLLVETFSSTKNPNVDFYARIFGRIFSAKLSMIFLTQLFFDRKLFSVEKIHRTFRWKNPTPQFFRPTNNFRRFFFRQMFSDFFRRKMFDQYFFGSPIPIANDPKIPKITLRTAYEHYKNTNSGFNQGYSS